MARGYPDYRYFSFPVAVNEGGLGVGTLALYGVLLGNATSPVVVSAAGNPYEVLRVPALGGFPAFAPIDLSEVAALVGLLSILKGGTGTATGSITGSGALIFTAGGADQDVTLTPSGAGRTILKGKVGIGALAPAYRLSVGQNDQGFDVPAANRLGVYVYGAERARFTDGGLEIGSGIGNLNGVDLQVAKIGFQNPGAITARDSGGTQRNIWQFLSDNHIYHNAMNGGDIVFRSADGGTVLLRIFNNGNVALAVPLAVAQGGTGTATGSITGTGALVFTAGGVDQSISLVPSGGGYAILNGAVIVCAGRLLVNTSAFSGYSGVPPTLELKGASIPATDADSGSVVLFGIDAYAADKGAALAFGAKYDAGGNSATGARVRGAKENATSGDYAFYLALDTRAVGGGITEKMRITSGGLVGIGTPTPGKELDVVGNVRASVQLISTVATGTAPLDVTSTTKVSNLNADRIADTQITNAAAAGLVPIGTGAGTAAWGTPDGCRVYNSAAQTIPNASATELLYDTERYDNGGLHSTVTNKGRLTAVKAGKYFIVSNITWAANATGYRQIQIVHSVAGVIAEAFLLGYNLLGQSMSVSTVYHLAAGEYVNAQANQTSTGNLDISGTPGAGPEFSMQWLGP